MAALADPPKAKCSYIDHLFVTFSQKLRLLANIVAFCLEMLISTRVVIEKTLFHFEPPLI